MLDTRMFIWNKVNMMRVQYFTIGMHDNFYRLTVTL